jgi:DnaJ-domain-containing protein 1
MSAFWDRVRRIAKSYWYEYSPKHTEDDSEEEFDEEEEELDEEEKLRQMIEDIARAQDARHQQFSDYDRRSSQKNSTQNQKPPTERKQGMTLPRAFAILALVPTADEDEIKRAYKKLMLMYHPDKTATLQPALQKEAHAKAREINIAYQFLRQKKGF